MRSLVPNTITLLNLFFGCCALLQVLLGRPDLALWFVLGSFACDTADGFVARAFNADSSLGKQLDSLADVVSFGVVPGAMLYTLLLPQPEGLFFHLEFPGLKEPIEAGSPFRPFYWPALPAFIFSMSAAYRLGKFNLDTRQTGYFLGLSTPAATVFVLGLVLAAFRNRYGAGEILAENPWLVYVLIAVLSWLMVSELPLAGLKIKGFGWKGNEAPITFLGLFILLFAIFRESAFCIIILVYILYSVVFKNKITAV